MISINSGPNEPHGAAALEEECKAEVFRLTGLTGQASQLQCALKVVTWDIGKGQYQADANTDVMQRASLFLDGARAETAKLERLVASMEARCFHTWQYWATIPNKVAWWLAHQVAEKNRRSHPRSPE